MTRPPALKSALHFIVNAACGYESFALSTGLVPPISAIHPEKRALKIGLICGPLALHLWEAGG